MRRAHDDIGNCKMSLNTLVGRQLWQCFDGNRGLGNLWRRNVRKMSKKSPSKHHFLSYLIRNMMIFKPMHSSFPIFFVKCEQNSKTDGKKLRRKRTKSQSRNVRKMSPSKHHFLHLDKTKHFSTNTFFFSNFLHGM